MDGRFDRNIVVSFIQVVENPAEINKGAVCPIVFIYDLQFQIDNSMIVQLYFDIKEKCFLVYMFSKFDRIANFDRENGFNVDVYKRQVQSCQTRFFTFVLERQENLNICQRVWNIFWPELKAGKNDEGEVENLVKIGIVTIVDDTNYGNRLQNYAVYYAVSYTHLDVYKRQIIYYAII